MSKKIILHYPKYQNIVEQYLSLDEFCGKATETIRSKRVTVIAFYNYLGDNGIESINLCQQKHVVDFMENISILSSSTRSGKAFILRHFFNFLHSQNLISYSGKELFPVIVTNKLDRILYMDLWNNEILSHSLSSKRGDRMTYINGLENLLEIKKQHPEYQMILHSDQGSVYASKAYNDLLPMYVVRSMSRAGTPTDNSAMESINGWIKAELFMDFHVTGERPVYEEVNEYIKFFNEERPAYALSYLTPKQYRERYAA